MLGERGQQRFCMTHLFHADYLAKFCTTGNGNKVEKNTCFIIHYNGFQVNEF